jgi:hypothetical protein
MIDAKLDLTVAQVAADRPYEIAGNSRSDVTWLDGKPAPTDQQWADAEAVVNAMLASEVIRQKRAAEYPPVQEQMDMMYHDALNGTLTWVDMVRSIKSKHPK